MYTNKQIQEALAILTHVRKVQEERNPAFFNKHHNCFDTVIVEVEKYRVVNNEKLSHKDLAYKGEVL